MIGIMATTVKAEPIRCCVLSTHGYTVTLFDDWALLESVGSRLANCTVCRVLFLGGVLKRCGVDRSVFRGQVRSFRSFGGGLVCPVFSPLRLHSKHWVIPY